MLSVERPIYVPTSQMIFGAKYFAKSHKQYELSSEIEPASEGNLDTRGAVVLAQSKESSLASSNKKDPTRELQKALEIILSESHNFFIAFLSYNSQGEFFCIECSFLRISFQNPLQGSSDTEE